jgi:fluoroquinolone transport system permease protein
MSKTINLLRSLGPVDLKSVARDSMLLLISGGALALALALRFIVPFLTGWLQTRFGLDLIPYYPLLMSLVLFIAPGMMGTVIGLLLLDERDDRTLTALMVTPIPLSSYVMYRLGLPVLLAFLITPPAVLIAGLIVIPFGQLLLVSALASISGATTALLLAALAENKVTGLAVLKGIQGLQALPLAAYFLTPPLQWIAGIMPSYWPLAVYWRMAAGEPFWPYLGIGVLVNVAVVWFLMKRYERRIYRQ